jgi:hypothetical protein
VGFVGLTLCLAFLAILGAVGANLSVTVSFWRRLRSLGVCLLLATVAYLGSSVTGSSVSWFECGSGLE